MLTLQTVKTKFQVKEKASLFKNNLDFSDIVKKQLNHEQASKNNHYGRKVVSNLLFGILIFALFPNSISFASGSVLARYDPGARGTVYLSQATHLSTAITSGVAPGPLRQIGTPDNESNKDRYVAFKNPGNSLNPNNYLTFSLTPLVGNSVVLTRIEFQTISYKGDGNTNSSIRSSLDNFQRDLGRSSFVPRGNGGAVAIELSPTFEFNAPIEFRIYMWGSTNDWSDIAGGGAVTGANGLSVLGSVKPNGQLGQSQASTQDRLGKCKAISSWNTSLSADNITKATDMIDTDSNYLRITPATGDQTSIVLDCGSPVKVAIFSLWYDRSSSLDSWPTKWTLYGSNNNLNSSWQTVHRSISGEDITTASRSRGSYLDTKTEFRYYRFVVDAVKGPNTSFVSYQDIWITPSVNCLAIGKSPDGNSPSYEDFRNATDGLAQTKYLNFVAQGEKNSLYLDCGIAIAIAGIKFQMANDEPRRDPKKFTIWGSNDNPLTKTPTWLRVGVSSRDIECPSMNSRLSSYCNRFEESNFAFLTTTDLRFRYLKVVVDEVRGPNSDAVQYSEVRIIPQSDRPGSMAAVAPSAVETTSSGAQPVVVTPNDSSAAEGNRADKQKAKQTIKKPTKVSKKESPKSVPAPTKVPAKTVATSITCLKGTLTRKFVAKTCPAGWVNPNSGRKN